MISRVGSVSSRASIPPTSKPSATPSIAPSPRVTSSTETASLTVVGAVEDKSPLEQIPPLAGPVVALIAIWAVHGLTKSRDREKAVFELYKTVGDAVGALKPVVLKAWSEEDPEARRVAVAETVWRLQQIGGFVERIRRQSSRWAWRGVRSPAPLRAGPYPSPDADAAWRNLKLIRARTSPRRRRILTWTRHMLLPFRWTVDIKATSAMARLRDAITADPFDDPSRHPDKGRHESVELAVGEFLQSLDERLIVWMDAGKED